MSIPLQIEIEKFLLMFHLMSRWFRIMPELVCPHQGRIQEFEKGGGGAQHTVFFRTTASLETRASPKKADKREGGGGGGFSNRGIAGWNQTLFFCFFCFRFQKGGHMYKKGGGAFIEKCFKRGGGGHEPAVPPPPPKSATGPHDGRNWLSCRRDSEIFGLRILIDDSYS